MLHSRRAFLTAASVAAIGCSRRRATGYAGYCLVANRDGHSVAVIDLSTFRLLRSIGLGTAPSSVVAHPRLPRAFVLTPDNGTVLEIDANSLAVSRRVRVGSRTASMLLAPDNRALWVLCQEPAALIEITLDSFQPYRHIQLPSQPRAFDLSPDGRAAIAADSVLIASLDRAAVEHTVAVAGPPGVISFQQKGAQIIVGCEADRSVTMIDAPTGRTLVRLPIAVAPRHLCFADEGTLFVSGDGKDAVVIIYPYQTEVGETVLAGRAPEGMAVAAAQGGARYLLVSNPATNSVTVLDVDSRRLVAVVEVGREPGSILITPDNQYALVLNEKSGDLAVIRIAALAARRFKSAPLFTLIPVGQRPVGAAVVTLA